MKLKIYFFGKQNEVTDWEQKHLKRIGFRVPIEIVALSQAGLSDIQKTKTKEADLFLSKVDARDFVVVLDEHGKTFDSVQFSGWLTKKLEEYGRLTLVIGGAHGLEDRVLERANAKISLGQMVWTRNLARLMLLEQLYRALEIEGGGNFHKV